MGTCKTQDLRESSSHYLQVAGLHEDYYSDGMLLYKLHKSVFFMLTENKLPISQI
jgi:hypothetical protein